MDTYKIHPDAHAANLAELDRAPSQPLPLLSLSRFEKSDVHEIMLFEHKTVNKSQGFDACQPGCLISFVAVRGFIDWAAYYMVGPYTPEQVAETGYKLTKSQVSALMHCEGDLIEKYRN